MPTEQEKADLSKRRGQVAASITDPEARRKFIAEQGDTEAKGKLSDSVYAKLSKDTDDTEATGGKNKDVGAKSPLDSYKNGTDYVPKTGNYKLHEGESVTPAEDNPAAQESTVHTPEEKNHFSRAMHKLHKGALHEHLGIPENEPIPYDKKMEASQSDNKHVAAMGRLALAMHGFKHGKK